MNSHLLSLPSEALHELLTRLDWRDLLTCRLVCHRLNAVIKTTSELLYTIDLRKYGMVDGGSSSLPHSERLALLRDRGRAWRNLDWKRVDKVDINGDCIAYELVGGVFAKSSGDDLFFRWLPSTTHEGFTIHHKHIDPSIRDFAIDPAQDLVVLLEEDSTVFPDWSRNIWLRLRTMTRLTPHPDAQRADLRFKIRNIGNARVLAAFVQLASDILAVFLSSVSTPRLVMWNWKDGTLLCDLTEDDIHDGSWDFELISTRSFLITSYHDDGALLLYKFLYPRGTLPVHVATLHLPRQKDNYMLVSLDLHSGPLLAGTPEGAIFSTAPDSRIHVITVCYQDRNPQFGHFGVKSYFLYVHNRTFQEYIKQYERLEGTWDEEPMDVPWEQWGPKNTHFSPIRSQTHWLRYVQGERVVCQPEFRDGETLMQVWDFNTLPSEEPHERLVSLDPITAVNLPFRDPVRTSLAYHIRSGTVAEAYKAFMIDEERIIGLKADPTNDEAIVSLHVYSF